MPGLLTAPCWCWPGSWAQKAQKVRKIVILWPVKGAKVDKGRGIGCIQLNAIARDANP
jgi:hypothetical protein